jgi:hypothetical protein
MKVWDFEDNSWKEATPEQLSKFERHVLPSRRDSQPMQPISDGAMTVKVPRRG